MVRLSELPEASRDFLLNFDCPTMDGRAFVAGKPLAQRRVAIVTTAGLQRRGESAFHLGSADFRVIPGDVKGGDLVMTHASINFDRSGFQEDVNVAFPIDRLRELTAQKTIGSMGEYHYSFMGVTHPEQMKPAAAEVARLLKDDGVDSVVLCGV